MNALERACGRASGSWARFFLVAGLTKIWDPVLFFWEAMPHIQFFTGSANWEHIATWALLLGPLECAVGLALLVDWKPRLALPVGVVLMAFFIFITALAWHRGTAENCGCFGTLVKRSPGEALIEDIAMLGAVALFVVGVAAAKGGATGLASASGLDRRLGIPHRAGVPLSARARPPDRVRSASGVSSCPTSPCQMRISISPKGAPFGGLV